MKILLLTSNYPADDIPKVLTSVIHSFTKEWVKLGHDVIVIHNQTSFPKIVYPVLKFLKKILENITGYFFVLHKLQERHYVLDGVQVYRCNMLKMLPRLPFLESSYQKQIVTIRNILNHENFVPDVIIGHWISPQLRLVSDLSKFYSNAKTALVIHEELPIIQRDYKNRGLEYLKNIEVIGFRSQQIKYVFEQKYDIGHKNSFICYSGIPDFFISKKEHAINLPLQTYTFIGTLILRKHPEALLKAVTGFQNKISINYIGNGPLEQKLIDLSRELNLSDSTHFLGRIPRSQVNSVLADTDCFIMISSKETFGLVYLEAMANGCITIASKNEGADGIIVDGKNGFLCEAGNDSQLREILSYINNADKETISKISQAARQTAQDMTDKKVAINYLNALDV